MSKKFATLRKQMSPSAQQRSHVRAAELDAITIQPCRDCVLLEYEESESQTAGGLFIPQQAQTKQYGKSYIARVLAVGPGRYSDETDRRLPMDLEPGDRVAVPQLNFPIKMGTKTIKDARTGATLTTDREVYLVSIEVPLGYWRE